MLKAHLFRQLPLQHSECEEQMSVPLLSIGKKVHIPVDTAMDTKSAATAMGVTLVGALAFITKRSIV